MLKKSLQERNFSDCVVEPSRAVPINFFSRQKFFRKATIEESLLPDMYRNHRGIFKTLSNIFNALTILEKKLLYRVLQGLVIRFVGAFRNFHEKYFLRTLVNSCEQLLFLLYLFEGFAEEMECSSVVLG